MRGGRLLRGPLTVNRLCYEQLLAVLLEQRRHAPPRYRLAVMTLAPKTPRNPLTQNISIGICHRRRHRFHPDHPAAGTLSPATNCKPGCFFTAPFNNPNLHTAPNASGTAPRCRGSSPGSHDFSLVFVPRRTIACERVLEEEGVLGDVTIGGWDDAAAVITKAYRKQ